MNFSALLEVIPAFLAIMLIGYIGTRKNVFGPEFVKSASFLLTNILLSASIFNSICGDMPEMPRDQLLRALFVMTVSVLVCFIIAGIASVFANRCGIDPTPYETSINTVNALLIGMPIIQEVYEPAAVLYTGLYATVMNFLLFTYGVARLSQTGDTGDSKIKLKDILSPCLVSIIISIAIFSLRIKLPGVVLQFTKYLGNATVPMSMLIVGTMMASDGLLDAFRDRRVYVLALISLILTPLIVWPIVSALTNDIVFIRSAVVISACPCGFVVPILSMQYGHDPILPSRAVLVTTLLSMLTLPVWVYIIG